MAPLRPTPLSDVFLAPDTAQKADLEQLHAVAAGATLLGRTGNNFMSMAGKVALTPVKQFVALEAECMVSPGAPRLTPMAAFTPISTPSPSQRFSLFARNEWAGSRTGLAPLRMHHVGPQEIASEVEAGPRHPGLQPDDLILDRQVVSLQQALNNKRFGDAEEVMDDDSDVNDPDDQERIRTLEAAPRPPPGALHPSVGSEGHALGVCKRCCFFPRGRCMNGYTCEFCHYEHEKRKRKNKKGSKANLSTGSFPPHLRGLLSMPAMGGVAPAFAPAMQSCFQPVATGHAVAMHQAVGAAQYNFHFHTGQSMQSMQSCHAPAVMVTQPQRPPGNLTGHMQMSMVPVQQPQQMLTQMPAQMSMQQMPAQMLCQAQPYMMTGTMGCPQQPQSNMQVVMLDPAFMPQQAHVLPGGPGPACAMSDIPPPPMQPPSFCCQARF